MARVTVEDCVLVVPNRFDLVALAARRAKDIEAGKPISVERDNDKDSVVALREIAEKTIHIEELREGLIQHFCKRYAQETTDSDADESGSESKTSAVIEASDDKKETPSADSSDPESAASQVDMSFGEENVDVED